MEEASLRDARAAKLGRDAGTLATAATALARVGAACASWHQVLGKPDLRPGEAPAEGSGAQLHMVRHQWAADRLWDGLIAPSDESWIKGAEALADAPLAPGELAPEQSVSPQVTQLASNVHAQAHAARGLPQEMRGGAYAELLRTCSGCHQSLGARLK